MSFKTGGSETMLADIINEQIKTDEISLIIFNNQINNEILDNLDERVKVYKLNRKEKSRKILPVIILNLLLLKIWPDVIHSHHASSVRIIFFKRNLVLTAHTTGINEKRFKTYNRVYAISETVKNDIYCRYRIDAKVVYNGINFNHVFKKDHYDFDVFKIVQVSRLDHETKGQHILIEALNILIYKMKVLNVSIDFIGEGSSNNYLYELVEKYKLQQKVNFLGSKDREYIYSHLRDYNLLVQPSFTEGFGLTITEGMAARIPVLVSNIKGPLEIIENGKYGWVFEAGDYSDCANKIEFIIQIYQTNQMLHKIDNAYNFVCEKFSIKTTSNNYLAEYKDLICSASIIS